MVGISPDRDGSSLRTFLLPHRLRLPTLAVDLTPIFFVLFTIFTPFFCTFHHSSLPDEVTCSAVLDVYVKLGKVEEVTHELLYLGTLYGLYPGLHNKNANEWCLDVRSLSIGAAHTALEEWMGTLYKIVQREEALPKLFSAQTGAGTHKFSQGMASSFGSHVKKLAAPFRQSEEKAGCFVATREDLVAWVQ